MPGCVARGVGRAGGEGPFVAASPPPLPGGAVWPWAVGLGLVLGAALALALWAWCTRPASGRPGRWWGEGDAGRVRAALRLVEQVIHDSNHRMKVVPFDKWVEARRKKKKGGGQRRKALGLTGDMPMRQFSYCIFPAKRACTYSAI